MIYESIIIGGGVAGLAYARAMQQKGRPYLLLERTCQLFEVGAGLSLWPNALEALAALDVDVRDIPDGASWTHLSYWDGDRSVAEFETGAFDDSARVPLIVCRSSLHSQLGHGLNAENLVLNADVVSAELSQETWTLKTRDGREFKGRFLVGADGWRSHARRTLGGSTEVREANYLCVRANIVHKPPFPDGHGGEIYVQNGVRFGYFSFRHNGVYWFAFVPRKLLEVRSLESVLRDSARANAISKDLVNVTPQNQWIVSDIGDMAPVTQYAKRCGALLGDAAHPMQPSFGQGAGLALEDAVCLADIVCSNENLEDVGRSYLRQRRRRWKRMFMFNRYSGWILQSDFRFVRAAGLSAFKYGSKSRIERMVRDLFQNPT